MKEKILKKNLKKKENFGRNLHNHHFYFFLHEARMINSNAVLKRQIRR